MTDEQRTEIMSCFRWVSRAFWCGDSADAVALDVDLDDVTFDSLSELSRAFGTTDISLGADGGYYGEPTEYNVVVRGITRWPRVPR